MRKVLAITMFLCSAAPAFGQRLTLDVPGMADRATEMVDVTLDGPLLRLAAKFLTSDEPEERAARDIALKLQGIYVKSYTFDKEGAYDSAVVDPNVTLTQNDTRADIRFAISEGPQVLVDHVIIIGNNRTSTHIHDSRPASTLCGSH